MNWIFSDFYEISRVIKIIAEQWEESPDCDPPMPTVNYLARLLQQELIEHGGVTAEQIENANEIVFHYLPDKNLVEPGMWQYAFADCLATLLIYFSCPIGRAESAAESLARAGELDKLEQSFVAVLMADTARFREQAINILKPKAVKFDAKKARERAANRINAQKMRKHVTKDQLLEFRDAWLRAEGKEQGWKKQACRKFGISQGTLRKRIEQ